MLITHTHTHTLTLHQLPSELDWHVKNWCLCRCYCLAVKLCTVFLLNKGHSSWQHKALAINGWWMTWPTGQALTSLLPPSLGGVIYSVSQDLSQSFRCVQPVGREGWSRKIPVGQALLYLFAQWLVLVTHTHTHTLTHTNTPHIHTQDAFSPYLCCF